MARWHYPRWRRILMQMALCAIFAGSVALASLVTRHRLAGGNTQLAGIRWFGRIGVRAPAGWSLESENQGPVLLVVREPQSIVDGVERGGRRLAVRRRQLDAPVSAEDYLKFSGLLLGTQSLSIEGIDSTQLITIAGATGIMRPVLRPEFASIFSTPTYITEWIACVVRPNGLAITVQLDCPDSEDPEGDKQYLRDIASAIEVRDALSN